MGSQHDVLCDHGRIIVGILAGAGENGQHCGRTVKAIQNGEIVLDTGLVCRDRAGGLGRVLPLKLHITAEFSQLQIHLRVLADHDAGILVVPSGGSVKPGSQNLLQGFLLHLAVLETTDSVASGHFFNHRVHYTFLLVFYSFLLLTLS